MTPELRVELLRMTKPNFDLPDLELWMARANVLEAWVDRIVPVVKPELEKPAPTTKAAKASIKLPA